MNNRPSPNKTRQIGFLVLIFVLLLGTIYSMTRNTAKESLVYSEVIELFETKQVESFTIDTDGNLTMQLRSAYKGQTKYSYECGSFSIFYNDLNDLVQEQKAEGILTEYDYPPAWEAAWWLSFVPYLIIFVIMGVLWYSMIRSGAGRRRCRRRCASFPRRAPVSAARKSRRKSRLPTSPARMRKRKSCRRSSNF